MAKENIRKVWITYTNTGREFPVIVFWDWTKEQVIKDTNKKLALWNEYVVKAEIVCGCNAPKEKG